MSTVHAWRRGGVIVAALVLAAALPLTTGASRSNSPTSRAHAVLAHVITFGRYGGNIRPLSVSIDASGVVTTSYPLTGSPTSVHLSADTIGGLLTLATAEGFFRLPSQLVGHGLPDIGGRFITIHAPMGTKTVFVRYVHKAAFDQLYAVLSAVAGVQA